MKINIHEMWMPDLAQIKQVAPEYEFLVSTDTWYKTLPKQFRGYFESFGKDGKTDPPQAEPPPQVHGDELANFKNYSATAQSLRQAMVALTESGQALAPLAHKTAAISEGGQRAINEAIDLISKNAPTKPKPGMKEDQHIYEYCNAAIQAAVEAINAAAQANKENADGLDKDAAKLKELEAQIKKLQQENADLKKKLLDPPTVPQVPTTPTTPGIDPTQVPPIDDNSKVPGLDDLNPTTPGVDTGTTPTGTSLDDKVQKALDDISSATNPTNATPASVPNAAAASPANSGMDMMSSLLPMMMSQMMNRGQADTDLNSRRDEYDPYYDREAGVVPAAVTPAQPAVQPATSTPAHPTNTAPPATSSSQPTTGMPGRQPNADGSVVYTFPDGRTQKVSAAVAQALDAAFGNASGTDAQVAYAKTPAKWSDKKQIGTPVDPYQLMTGDVAVWDGRTAILVVFGSEEGGTLEAVVNGQLKQFAAEMSDSAGEFGQFVGFSHPHGIEATAPGDTDKTSGTPVTGDPSVSAAMPAVAAPA